MKLFYDTLDYLKHVLEPKPKSTWIGPLDAQYQDVHFFLVEIPPNSIPKLYWAGNYADLNWITKRSRWLPIFKYWFIDTGIQRLEDKSREVLYMCPRMTDKETGYELTAEDIADKVLGFLERECERIDENQWFDPAKATEDSFNDMIGG